MTIEELHPAERSREFRPIHPVKEDWLTRAQTHLDNLTKPPGSLGRLEEIAARLVAIQQSDSPRVDKKAVFVFAADHGVAVEGVSAYPRAVTEQMVLNFLCGGAAINVLARAARAELHVVDVGVAANFDHAQLISRKVTLGTKNFLHEPAMSQDELHAALAIGRGLALEAHSRGLQLVALGEMGIGNTTSASAITAALTGESAAQVTGHGTGVVGAAFNHKEEIVESALRLHFPGYLHRRPDPLEILRCIGGLEIAAICGFILSAAHHRMATVVDGFISTAAAAIACSLQPAARGYLFGGHLSREKGHALLLKLIGLEPLLDLKMRLGEGTGAVLACNIIDAAARIYNEMATFQSAGVSGATGE